MGKTWIITEDRGRWTRRDYVTLNGDGTVDIATADHDGFTIPADVVRELAAKVQTGRQPSTVPTSREVDP